MGASADKVTGAVMMADRMHALQQTIYCCGKGGTVFIPRTYGGQADKLPFVAFMNKGLAMKTGQTHTLRSMKPPPQKIEAGEIDPSFIITHTVPLEKAPEMYKNFQETKDGCIKVVLKP